MARLAPSRDGLVGGTPVPLTLAQVHHRLSDVTELSARKRSDLRSALNVIGRALGRPLETIPASPKMLRDMLDKVGPAAAGLNPQSWANTRSRLNTALRLTGVEVMGGRRIAALTPDWQQLQNRLPDPYFRLALSRFASFCSARGIKPGEVQADTFERFQSSVELQSLRRRPQDGYRETVKAWNRARREIAGWPDVAVAVPNRRDWYCHETGMSTRRA